MEPTKTEIFYGGVDLEITLNNGAKETVRVRMIPIRHVMHVFNIAVDEPALIGYCTGKPAEWVDSLTQESHLALVEKAKELNFSRAVALAERQIAEGKILAPVSEKLTNQVKLLSASLLSVPPSASS